MKDEVIGALVGWDSQPIGTKMMLRLQCVSKSPPHVKSDIESYRLVLDKNQAVQLAHYLYTITGQTPPTRKAGWLERLRGS